MRAPPKLSDKTNEHGHYEIRWSELYGKRWRSKRRSTGTGDYSEAVQELARFLTVREADDSKSLTVRQVFDRYIRYHSTPRGNEVTDRRCLRVPLVAFGDWTAAGIKDQDVEFYIRRRMSGAYGEKPVVASTVRREIVALQAMLNYGCKKGMVPKDRFALPKPSDGEPRQAWISEQDQTVIVEKMNGAPLDVRLFFRLALTYGVRKGAIMDLRFGPQVDFIGGSIDFHVPGARVTRKRRPAVPMTASVRADLEEMFSSKKRGETVCDKATPDRYRRFMEDIGYGWVTPHVLKHSAITLMLRDGVEPGDVARLTATDLRTIYRVYRHHTHEELRSIAERRGL